MAKARHEYGVHPPTLYLPESDKNATKYNCIQRSHQNVVTERLPLFVPIYILASAFHPTKAVVFAGTRFVTFIFYARGYQTGIPKKRGNPLALLGYLVDLGLMYLSVSSGIKLLRSM